MKTSINLIAATLVAWIALLLSYSTFAQTNVSGGIYSNTTWTKAKSPYIVTDTIVVFPGVILTIQPGVTVKFTDNKRLEIRQAKLIAIGTSTDSITFTSNAASPTIGIWGEILINSGTDTSVFNYCNFRYANYGIYFDADKTLIIKNSNFKNNNDGLYCGYIKGSADAFIDSTSFIYNLNYGIAGSISGIINYCNISNNKVGLSADWIVIIKNCTIKSNQTGISASGALIYTCNITYNQTGISSLIGTIQDCIISYNIIQGIFGVGDSVINCEIKYNGIGFHDWDWAGAGTNVITKSVIENNAIGIKIESLSGTSNVYCNKICNNTTYDFYNASSRIVSISNNYWCITDSATIASHIYDGYDNINKGIVSFMPLDTQQCYLSTGIPIKAIQNNIFTIYPNPTKDHLTLTLSNKEKTSITIYDILGNQITDAIHNKKEDTCQIDLSAQQAGVYFIKVQNQKTSEVKKVVLVK